MPRTKKQPSKTQLDPAITTDTITAAETETTALDITLETQQQTTPPAAPANDNSGDQQPPYVPYISPLERANIAPPTPEQIAETAAREGWAKNNAYGATRVRTLTQQQIFGQTMKLKQQARKYNYNIAELLAGPAENMIDALDKFDLMCYETGLQPLEHLLAVWLNCSIGELDAIKTTANINANAKLIVDHQAFAISVISQMAMQSDKPPVFSIYYLKAVHRMFDNSETAQTGIAINNATINARFSIGGSALHNNARLFIDADENT